MEQKVQYYAGIGSRETPEDILALMSNIAAKLENEKYILRSGGADGADSAFEKGVGNPKNKEIYLPWKGFEGSTSLLYTICDKAYQIAEIYHPNWKSLSEGSKKLHARNAYQVLGKSLDKPVSFVICWTPHGEGGGGTGQAIRIAKAYDIPIFDLGVCSTEMRLRLWLRMSDDKIL